MEDGRYSHRLVQHAQDIHWMELELHHMVDDELEAHHKLAVEEARYTLEVVHHKLVEELHNLVVVHMLVVEEGKLVVAVEDKPVVVDKLVVDMAVEEDKLVVEEGKLAVEDKLVEVAVDNHTLVAVGE